MTLDPQLGQLDSRDAGSIGWRVVKMARMSCEIFAWRAWEIIKENLNNEGDGAMARMICEIFAWRAWEIIKEN